MFPLSSTIYIYDMTYYYCNTILSSMGVALIYICGIALIIFLTLPFLLATITCIRQHLYYDTTTTTTTTTNWDDYQSSLYFGRVWHSRLVPKFHSFTYPLFLFGLELYDEVEQQQLFQKKLWPLSCIMNFHNSDHFKSSIISSPNTFNDTTTSTTNNQTNMKNDLSDRIMTLIAERTQQQFVPTIQTHRIYLLTHLSYYGYCFNPVSFYYIFNKQTNQIDAMIGEVSNTPWNEMYCYVLHETSVDDVTVLKKNTTTPPSSSQNNLQQQPEQQQYHSIHYVFPKQFHVSPFMEMEYKYDWTFTNNNNHNVETKTQNTTNTTTTTTTTRTTPTDITIINEMRSIHNNKDKDKKKDNQLCFRAKMHIQRKSLHPYCAAYYITTFPMYCFLIQIWIHYEAFQLFFWKGITFQPHPMGTETTISKLIGTIMIPFFALQEQSWWNNNNNTNNKKNTSTKATKEE